jgi:GAF domain-containing protein
MHSEAASTAVTGPKEEALWAALASAVDAGEYCRAWLDLQCARTPGAVAGLVLLESQDNAFAPAALWPSAPADLGHLRKVAEQALTGGQAVVEADPERAGHTGVAYPISAQDRVHGAVVLAIAGASPAQLQSILRELHWGVGWLLSIVWQHRALEEGQSGASAAAALDVLAAVEEHETLPEAAMALCNTLAIELDAERVSFGLIKREAVKLAAVSHGAWFRKRSDVTETIEAAMEEAYDQSDAVLLPALPGRNHVTLQQARLAESANRASVVSLPVVDRGRTIGVLTLERATGSPPFDARDLLFCEAVAGVVAPLLELKLREERWIGGKLRRKSLDTAGALFGPRRPLAKVLGIAAVLLLLFLLLPIAQFRVSADAALEGRVQRAAAVPFSGYIARSHARAGDVVREGQVLATLDDRDLRLDRAKSIGQVQELDRRYREALANHKRAEMNLFGAQLRQAEAELRLIDYKLARTNITAPLSGVLVSGDVSQLVGTPVEEGEVLFEVAPLEGYRVAVQVEETDITYLRPGQTGRFAPTGLAGETVPFVISKLTSVTAAADGKNTFRVEAELGRDVPPSLRPGMEGVAKVTIDRRSRLWIWTRGIRNWLRLFAWRWLP